MENCAWLCGLVIVLMDENDDIGEMAAKHKAVGQWESVRTSKKPKRKK